MAERRMFAKTIIDSDAFLEMPMSARLLYYDLGMRADDDGFVNSPKKIMKISGASNDDMNILILRKFIIPFEKGIVVIKHWKIHNYIRSDRYKPTVYVEEKAMLEMNLNDGYTLKNKDGIPNGYQMDTQDRIGESSIDKDSIGQDSINPPILPPIELPKKELQLQFEKEFEKLWEHYPNKKGKEQAKNKYILARKQGTTYEEVSQGLKNYLNYIKLENIELKYIKHGSTWFNQKCWNDDYKITNSSTKKNDEQWALLKGVYDGTIYMTQVAQMTGKESESAERVRQYRLRKKEEEQKQLMLHCNDNVTKSNDNKEKEEEEDKDKQSTENNEDKHNKEKKEESVSASVSDASFNLSDTPIGAFKKEQQRMLKDKGGQLSTECPPKIEIEQEKELEIEQEKELEIEQEKELEIDNNIALPVPTLPSKKDLQIQYEKEFNKLWEYYPNKKGKDQAKNKYILARKQGTTYEEVSQGLKNYLNYIKLENIELKYIKHGSTWFNQKCWNDDYKITNSSTKKNDEQWALLKGVYDGTIKIDK